MPLLYLIEGIIVGFLLATPVGPIGILCVRHTLVHGQRRGLVVGLGGASADVVYATVAAFGVRLISSFITDHRQVFRITGGVFLLLAGFFTLRSSATISDNADNLAKHTKVFVATFLLAMTNPLTLFAFAAAFTLIGVIRIIPMEYDLVSLVFGIFIGSFLWFFALTSLALLFKQQLTTVGLSRVNKIAGSLLILLGAVACLGGIGIL